MLWYKDALPATFGWPSGLHSSNWPCIIAGQGGLNKAVRASTPCACLLLLRGCESEGSRPQGRRHAETCLYW